MPEIPLKLRRRTLARSKIFHLESVVLRFENSTEVEFECIHHFAKEGVIVVPFTERGTVYMAREYALGSDRYELTFPRGAMDEGESPLAAAQREMREEIGHGCRDLRHIRQTTIAPSYMSQCCHVFVARNLFPNTLSGDEPEPLEVIELPIAEVTKHLECTDSLSIAAFYLALEATAS